MQWLKISPGLAVSSQIVSLWALTLVSLWIGTRVPWVTYYFSLRRAFLSRPELARTSVDVIDPSGPLTTSALSSFLFSLLQQEPQNGQSIPHVFSQVLRRRGMVTCIDVLAMLFLTQPSELLIFSTTRCVADACSAWLTGSTVLLSRASQSLGCAEA